MCNLVCRACLRPRLTVDCARRSDDGRCPDARRRLGGEDPEHLPADRVPQVHPHEGQCSYDAVGTVGCWVIKFCMTKMMAKLTLFVVAGSRVLFPQHSAWGAQGGCPLVQPYRILWSIASGCSARLWSAMTHLLDCLIRWLQVFPANAIFVCDNSPQLNPWDRTEQVRHAADSSSHPTTR